MNNFAAITATVLVITFGFSSIVRAEPNSPTTPRVAVGQIDYKGPWASTFRYSIGDIVTFNGSSYIAVKVNKNVRPGPGVSSIWGILAERGDDGLRGLRGAQGPAGQTGAAGPAGPIGPAGPQGTEGPAGPQGPQGTPGTIAGKLLFGKVDQFRSLTLTSQAGITVASSQQGIVRLQMPVASLNSCAATATLSNFNNGGGDIRVYDGGSVVGGVQFLTVETANYSGNLTDLGFEFQVMCP